MNLVCYLECVLLGTVGFLFLSGDGADANTTVAESSANTDIKKLFKLSINRFTNNITFQWTVKESKRFIGKYIETNCTNVSNSKKLKEKTKVNDNKVIVALTGLEKNTNYKCSAVYDNNNTLLEDEIFKTENCELPLQPSRRILATADQGNFSIFIGEISPSTTYAAIKWNINTNASHLQFNMSISCSCNKRVTPSIFSYIIKPINGSFKTDMDNLLPGTKYACNTTTSMNGTNSNNSPFQFDTKTILVENLTITHDAHDTYFVASWKQTTADKYQIYVEKLKPLHYEPDCSRGNRSEHEEVTIVTSYNYTNALPDYLYYVNVTAYNGSYVVGTGETNFSTKTSAPGVVEALHLDENNVITNANNTLTYNLSWTMPCSPNGNIESYKVNIYGKYTADAQLLHSDSLTVNANPETEIYSSLLLLRPSYHYNLSVQADSGSSYGPPANIIFTSITLVPGPLTLNITSKVDSIVVIWHEPVKPVGEILKYTLEIESLGPNYVRPNYCPADNYTNKWDFEKTTTYYEITSLNPYTKYRISVAATTSAGMGNKAIVNVSTLVSVPEQPSNITVNYTNYHKDNCEVKISWMLPCKLNGPFNHTFILLSGNSTEGPESTKKNFTVGKNQTLTTDVNYMYSYTIQIWLLLENNTEGLAAVYHFVVPSGFPGKVTSVNIVRVSNSTYDISWEPPADQHQQTGNKIVNYKIEVKPLEPNYTMASFCEKKNHDSQIAINTTTSQEIVLNPLYYAYIYQVNITAASVRGFGEGNWQNFTTVDAAPENVHIKPVQLQSNATDIYQASAIINFEPSCTLNGRLVNYTLSYMGKNEFNTDQNTTKIDGFYTMSLRPRTSYSYTITTYTENYSNTTTEVRFEAPTGVPKMNITGQKLVIEKSDSTAKVVLKKDYFNEDNGPIRFLGVLLANNNESGGGAEKYNKTDDWPVQSPDDKLEMRRILKNPFDEHTELAVVIGDENSCDASEAHCNTPLKPDKDYYLIVRAYTDDFYRNSPSMHFRTDPLSHLDLILGILFGILFVVLAAFVAFYMWRKRCIKIPNLRMLDTVIGVRKQSDQQNVALRTCYPPSKFITYCKHLENNRDLVREQFEMLKRKSVEFSETIKIHFAKLPENRRKNRYTNISPFDETRVKLMIDEDDEIGSDYINASYIKGYTGEVEYIATQGPLESTCRDFWKMILQENVSIIVMVSLFIEQDKVKCHRYFPKNHETMLIGDDIEVKCSVELHFGIYCIRTLQVKKDNFQTHVTHMQFLEWPDFGVPSGTDHMLQFCYRLRERINMDEGVMVVHCSAGVGRTGTLIATDILIQTANAGKKIDVYTTVEELRRQRVNMVQTEDQYFYIHRLIMEHLDRPQTPDCHKDLPPIYENMSIINNLQQGHGQKDEDEVESKF